VFGEGRGFACHQFVERFHESIKSLPRSFHHSRSGDATQVLDPLDVRLLLREHLGPSIAQ
jgi:hypothetical protein